MAKLLDEVMHDLKFIRSHELQPKWYKFSKILIIIGFVAIYSYFFGLRKAVFFVAFFLVLNFLLHTLYRRKTYKFQQSWMDFIVIETETGLKAKGLENFIIQ
jgi:Ca2+-dependent lipid-binding protein